MKETGSNLQKNSMKLILGLISGCLLAATTAAEQPIFRNPQCSIEQRVEDVLRQLTLEEKVCLTHGRVNEGRAENFQSGGVPRLNIIRLEVTDGPVGVRTFDQAPATALPSTLALSCTWDVQAARAYGRLVAEEMLAFNKHVLFGPGINLMRSPLGARNFEYMGEDPFLCGALTVNYVQGVQELGAAACVKHLVANDYDSRRHFTSSNMDERTLREMHLLPFEMAIRDGQVWSVMSANNLLNGVHAAENHSLLQDILKDELGFDGVMLTDWRAAYSAVPSALAGTDSTMGFCAYVFGDGKLLEAVRAGRIPEALIDDKARRILRLYIRTGVLDPESRAKGAVDTPEHRALARRLAAESMVLLKNDRNLLPLDPAKVRSILVAGPGAEAVPFGRGSSAVQSAVRVTPLQGLTAVLGDHLKITHLAWRDGHSAETGKRKGPTAQPSRPEPAVLQQAARTNDLVLFFATDPVHGEGTDLTSFDLPGGQAEAIASLAAANANLAVVLMTAEPLSLEPWADQVPAILAAWYAGQATGDAIADVLTGKSNPSGKLSSTFGRKLEDYPCHSLNLWPPRLVADKPPGEAGYSPQERKATCAYAADYKEGVFLGYRWFDDKNITPRFAFGHGLSYTTFALSDLTVNATGPSIRVACAVKNTGAREGAEVVQVYTSSPKSSVPRPPRELKGFAKVALKPGESRKVEITLRPTALAFYDMGSRKWKAEAGEYQVQVGTSSRQIGLQSTVKLAADQSFDKF
jgi:beta-glucosidase